MGTVWEDTMEGFAAAGLETCGYTIHTINVSKWKEKLCSATEFIALRAKIASHEH